ncbi:hypothetical protein Pse7367_2647 [Thalassoporum mexicanum PCC 7367]|uniref:hypothetical protein n=1 Tax=Thalassoporum mexicanum TaxID=3457544 RepID=UPI00029FA6EC|nr:hypothetical protein [Pseudanabaena sp. PCC 7367]AFY70903.1 hypothetical protein Pse7367_2647 [Pseudanabaena sp. PCC 7367]
MSIIETVNCPNCGYLAERHHLHMLAQVKTQCDACDYLMVISTRSGSVVESYAPGIYASQISERRSIEMPTTKPEVDHQRAKANQANKPKVPQCRGVELTPVSNNNMQIFLSQSVGKRRKFFVARH